MSLGWVGLGSIRFWFKIVRMNFRLSIGHSKRYSLTRDLTSLIKQCRSHLLFHLRLHRQAYCASVTHCLSLSRIVVILHTKSKHVARSCVKICLAGQGLRGLASAISLVHILATRNAGFRSVSYRGPDRLSHMAQFFHLTNGSSWNVRKVETSCRLPHPNRLTIRSDFFVAGQHLLPRPMSLISFLKPIVWSRTAGRSYTLYSTENIYSRNKNARPCDGLGCRYQRRTICGFQFEGHFKSRRAK